MANFPRPPVPIFMFAITERLVVLLESTLTSNSVLSCFPPPPQSHLPLAPISRCAQLSVLGHTFKLIQFYNYSKNLGLGIMSCEMMASSHGLHT